MLGSPGIYTGDPFELPSDDGTEADLKGSCGRSDPWTDDTFDHRADNALMVVGMDDRRADRRTRCCQSVSREYTTRSVRRSSWRDCSAQIDRSGLWP
jgi:hypothetical protein